MISLTIDASVFISAFKPSESDSEASQALLETVFGGESEVWVFSPTLLIVEVAASIARVFDDEDKGLAAASAVQTLPRQVFIPLTEAVAENASVLGTRYRLRGADAVYAAVAAQHGSLLVSLDKQQLDRVRGTVKTVTPKEGIRLLQE